MTSGITSFIQDFSFGYPFVMAWYWMVGGILYRMFRGLHEPMFDRPPKLDETPPVSILLPCHNEQTHAAETIAVLNAINYPDFEIIAINDGSTDRTREIFDDLVTRIPRLRVVHLMQNQGKSVALTVGALLARSEILVCTDGDAMLDDDSVTWFVRRLQSDGEFGGVTGNPRIRNRATILGQLQVGEYSSIVGLIKRAQSIYGWLFTVSGVMCVFRKRALHDIGYWSPRTLTDDVEVSWRMQLSGWRIGFEPKAICWVLMPETLKGLWRQRLRWSIGGTETVLAVQPWKLNRKNWSMIIIWTNYVASIVWAYSVVIGVILWVVDLVLPGVRFVIPAMSPVPNYSWGGILAFTYLAQAVLSAYLDGRFERGLFRGLFWTVWFPLVFWYMQAATAVVGLPKAIMRRRGGKGTWTSPDRGIV